MKLNKFLIYSTLQYSNIKKVMQALRQKILENAEFFKM